MDLFRMYWTRTFRKPGAIFLWLAVPFVFMVIYQLTFGGERKLTVGLAVMDCDSSFVSNLVCGSFSQGPLADLIEVYRIEDTDELEHLFRREQASAGVVIPDGFQARVLASEPTTLTFYRNPRHSISPQVAEGVVSGLCTLGNGALNRFREPMRRIEAFVDGKRNASADDVAEIARLIFTLGQQGPNLEAMFATDVKIVGEDEKEPWDINMAAMFFPGLLAFALMSASLSIEYRFLFDRKNRITHRLAMAPIRPAGMVLQQRLYAMAFLYVMGAAIAFIGGLVWRIPANGLWQVHMIAIALIFFIVGVNGTIFGLSNSIKATSAISSVVLMAMMLLGGGFFPVEFMPKWVQAAAAHCPVGMANIGVTQCLTGRSPTISIPVLYGCSLAALAVSIVIGRKRII
jgi:ABC-2 type transport system permease protein